MKKKLIALAVAFSTTVSASAMAWTGSGSGGTVDLTGELTLLSLPSPWEVKTGGEVTNLNAQVQEGQSVVNITVAQAIPILGIRTIENSAFKSQAGINPKIDYNNAIEFNGMTNGAGILTLTVRNANSEEIGTLTTEIFAGAGMARNEAGGGGQFSLYANGESFEGGLGESNDSVIGSITELISQLDLIDPEFAANFNSMNKADMGVMGAPSFLTGVNDDARYSVFYGSGIFAGKTIKINLTKPVAISNGEIAWDASLPVTVTYM